MIELYLRLPHWSRAAWWVLLFGVLGRVAFSKPLSGTVVPIYRNAGLRWLHCENLYAPALPLDVYRNPPIVAAFFAPWTLLPETTAAILWRIANANIYIAGLVGTVRLLRSYTPSRTSLGLFAFFAAVLVVPSFNNGQMNLLLIGSLLLAWVNLERDYLWRAAAWIVLASMFKIYPLAVGLLFCVAVPRLVGRLAVLLVLAVGLSMVCHEPRYVWEMYRAFFEFVERENQYRLLVQRVPWDCTMLPHAWVGLCIDDGTRKAVSAFAGLSFAGWVLWNRNSEYAQLLSLCLGCIWMTLFGPSTENSTYTLLAPVAALLFLHPENRQVRLAAWLCCLLLSLPILRGLFPSSEVLPFRTAQPIAAILLLFAVVREFRTRTSRNFI